MSSDPTNKPYQISVAPEAVEVGQDPLVFSGGVLLPLSARGSGVPGMPDRPWSRLTADIFYTNLPTIYSLALRREPHALRRLHAGDGREDWAAPLDGRTVRKYRNGCRRVGTQPGKTGLQGCALAGVFVDRSRFYEAEAARRVIESSLRARELTSQRLYYIAERALHHFQPGGQLFPGLDEPRLFLEEALPLMPAPSRQVLPVEDSVWIGTHTRDGRDVHFSFTLGSILLTSNRALSEWPDLFQDPLLASAGLDRLLDRAEVLVIRGPSFRSKDRKNLFEEVQLDPQLQ